MTDIRDYIFSDFADEIITGRIISEGEGILSGAVEAVNKAEELGLEVVHKPIEGMHVTPGKTLMLIRGTAKQLLMAEDLIIGLLAKPSGIATAAKAFSTAAGDSFRVVCGAWKKVDAQLKSSYRKAVLTGGCGCRFTEEPMLYLDKNYILTFGTIMEALEKVNSVAELKGRKKVVQVKGIAESVGEECWAAATYGADYVYVDTGNISDLALFINSMQYARRIPKLAFGGNVTLDMLNEIKKYPVEVVGVGRAILDAPLLDMKLNVITPMREHKCHCHSEGHEHKHHHHS